MGVKGEVRQKELSWEEVLEKTHQGWDIFVNELGKFPVSKAFKSPLRKERHSSFTIFCKEGKWFYKDWALDECGDAMKFVRTRYKLSFKEALQKICQDAGLSTGNMINVQSHLIITPPKVDEERNIQINFTYQKWKKEHHKFWENTGVDEERCLKYNTYAVKQASINRKRVWIGEKEIVFAYYAEDIDRVKLYFPERERGERFKGNVPGNFLWGLNSMEKCGKLIIQKSMKDLLVTSVIHPCVTSVESERSSIFTEPLIERINNLADEVYVSYGSDPQGCEQSKKITDKTGWKWVNPEKKYLPEINDFFGLTKAYKLEALTKLLKSKNIL